jgi:hypothetical protein
LTGDILLSNLAGRVENTGKRSKTISFDEDLYFSLINEWLQPENTIWTDLHPERLSKALEDEIFAICFESIEADLASCLSKQLHDKSQAYIGAIEVDDASQVHWYIYSNVIGAQYRVKDNIAYVFWDGVSEDSKDTSKIEHLKKIGFRKVDFESLNGRYTVFDEYHDFEHSRRISEWKRKCGSLLAFIVDGVAHDLGDAAPELGDKLWAALKTFQEAETDEEFAQVSVSCRRIIEYVSNELFPAKKTKKGERDLGQDKYRNRLLAFADKTRKSKTNIDLICVSTEVLAEQITKLDNLACKGVHKEVYRAAARRCLLRTIMLLDDILSLKDGAFEIKARLNFDDLTEQVFGIK